MGIVGPGEPHAAVQLDVVAGHPHAGLRRVAGGHRGGLVALGGLGVRRRRRGLQACPRHLELVEHVDEAVAYRLEGGDRLIGDNYRSTVLDGLFEGPVRRTTVSATRRDGHVSCTPATGRDGSRPLRSGRPGCPRGRAGRLAGRVEGRGELPRPAPREEGSHSLFPPRDDDGPVGTVPVEHERLVAVQDPVGALSPRPGPDRLQGVSVPLLGVRDGATAVAAGEVPPGVLRPERPGGEDRPTEDEKNGPGIGTRPICSEDDAHLGGRGAAGGSSGAGRPVQAEIDQRGSTASG